MGESYFVLLIQHDDEQKEELVSITSRLSIYADELGGIYEFNYDLSE